MNITFSHLFFDPTYNFLQSTGHTSPAFNQEIICKIKFLRDKSVNSRNIQVKHNTDD